MDDEETARSEEHGLRATIPNEWIVKPVGPVKLSSFDRSQKLVDLGSDNAVRGNKGYRSVRATAGVCEGDWYYEAHILPYQGVGAVRPGWTTRRSDVETPAGFDLYGFSLRDRTGEFVHCARRRAYGKPFSSGTFVGCRIQLPELTPAEREAVRKADHAWLTHRFVNLLQGQQPPDSNIDITHRAKLTFYLDGVCQGVPTMFQNEARADDESVGEKSSANVVPNFQSGNGNGNVASSASRVSGCNASGQKNNCATENPNTTKQNSKARSSRDGVNSMRAGVYYPTLSLFGEARARANFGPTFEFAPPPGTRPMCEAIEPVELFASQEEASGQMGGVVSEPNMDAATREGASNVLLGNGSLDATHANGLSERDDCAPGAAPYQAYHNFSTMPAAATAAASEALDMPKSNLDGHF